MEKEEVILYHLNDVIREGRQIRLSKEMPKIGIDEVLIGVQTDPTKGRAFEINNPELYDRFHKASGPAWFCSVTFSLLYVLPKENAEKYLAVRMEFKGEGKTFVGEETVQNSLRPLLLSHINRSNEI